MVQPTSKPNFAPAWLFVTAFIPDPVEKTTGTSAAEGVAADAMGSIYGAEVGPRRVMKYVKK
jgi:hypothetical protein